MSLRKHIPNSITSMNLLAGSLGVVLALQGDIRAAFLLMLAASVFDFSDGLAARLLGAYSPMGKELDSLADMVSFGLLPSVMLVETLRLHGVTDWISFLPLFLAVMSGLRLAKFNVDERQTTDFIGVATPTSALICGSLCYFLAVNPGTFLDGWAGSVWFLPAVAIVLGLLLVSEIPMFGMKVAKGHKLLDTKRIVFFTLAILWCIAVAVLRLNWSLAVLGVFVIYILENLVLLAFPVRQ